MARLSGTSKRRLPAHCNFRLWAWRGTCHTRPRRPRGRARPPRALAVDRRGYFAGAGLEPSAPSNGNSTAQRLDDLQHAEERSHQLAADRPKSR